MFGFIKRFFGIKTDSERRRKLYEEQLPPDSMRLPKAKLVKYVPELHPNVRKIADKKRGCLLEWDLTDEQRTPPKKSFFPKYFFKNQKVHKIVLDDFGRRAVELIDGKRSISAIAEKLREGMIYNQEQMEDAIIAYLGQFVRRNIVTIAPKR